MPRMESQPKQGQNCIFLKVGSRMKHNRSWTIIEPLQFKVRLFELDGNKIPKHLPRSAHHIPSAQISKAEGLRRLKCSVKFAEANLRLPRELRCPHRAIKFANSSHHAAASNMWKHCKHQRSQHISSSSYIQLMQVGWNMFQVSIDAEQAFN